MNADTWVLLTARSAQGIRCEDAASAAPLQVNSHSCKHAPSCRCLRALAKLIHQHQAALRGTLQHPAAPHACR